MIAYRADSRSLFMRGQRRTCEKASPFLEKAPDAFPECVSDGLPEIMPGWSAHKFE
jgi:hypothetical protein